jgi:hypothetical protein
MSTEQKTSRKGWLSNLYSIITTLTLVVIMAQVIIARRSMVESSEWEKAKITIENVHRFKENLKETVLYDNNKILFLADRGFPDFDIPNLEKLFSVPKLVSLLQKYDSLFYGDFYKRREDILHTLSVMDDFAYPIIMGYASEASSYRSAYDLYLRYSNFIMPHAFHQFKPSGHHAKLLHRLWRVKAEILYLPNWDIEELKRDLTHLLCFDESEVTPASLKQYEKKLEKELKTIQKEIEDFRKSSMK